jgi:hypothetical protein
MHLGGWTREEACSGPGSGLRATKTLNFHGSNYKYDVEGEEIASIGEHGLVEECG